MEIDVIYKYRSPEASHKDISTIAIATLELDPSEVLSVPHPVGEIVTLQRDDHEEHDEAPKEYVVVERSPILTQIGESGYTLSMLFVVVTDPDR